MTRRVSWFCCDSAIYRDPRVATLPDASHRWCYVVMLALEKSGELDGQDVRQFWFAAGVSVDCWAEALERMQEVGLLGDDLRPVGFSEWQKSALEADRSRRYRARRAGSQCADDEKRKRNGNDVEPSRRRHASVTLPSRNEHAPVTTETETETDKKKNTLSSSPPANIDGVMETQVDQVIEHFKTTTGKSRVSVKSKANRQHVRARLRDGATVEDLKAVADLKTAQVRAGKFKDQYLRIETLYNETKCQSYLAELDAIRAGPQMAGTTQQAADALRKFYEERNGNDGTSSGSFNPLGSSDGGEMGRGETPRLPGPAPRGGGKVPSGGD
jgi:uncharacterized phage protein (TIGR02220 family)